MSQNLIFMSNYAQNHLIVKEILQKRLIFIVFVVIF